VRWVSLRTIQPNRVLAQSIFDERGRVLLARGMVLSSRMVERLRRMGIGSVCIEDTSTDDLQTQGVVSPQTRQLVLDATYRSLRELANGTYSRVVKPNRVKRQLRPLLSDVIGQLKAMDGAGEHLGTVYVSDGDLYHHSVNVTFFALGVGIAMGLTEEQLIDLGIGTLLHDVGKLKIPESILKKPGRLTDEEFQYIKLHTSYGYELLRAVPDLSTASAMVALQHHERINGSGYPKGLQGEGIHYFSRITAVVDVYEALTANRVYRNAYLPHHAFELLLGGGGTQFDPLVIEAFVSTIAIYPVGMTLLLSTGHRAVVVRSPQKQTQRPIVRVIEDAEGNPVPVPWEMDLSKELTIEIVGRES
jgi:HD-GYP domain-containing protein (c-di-GMP phosphodiesterase class II)